MRLKFSAAAAVLMVVGVSAQSAAVDWGVHGSLEIGVNLPAMGNFLDTLLFEIAPVPYTELSTAVANTLGGGAVFIALSTGKYFYSVSAAAMGAFAGFYNLTSTVVPISPVPEPVTYAMMLAGLGAVGFLARRRKNG